MNSVVLIVVLLFSIVVHEVAHAWQARREGDDTAERLGRITLNPIPHLDLMGSLIVPGLLFLSNSGFLFGWAKPVPVDPRNYREYVAGDIRVSMAGIVSNLILATLATLGLALVVKLRTFVDPVPIVTDTVILGLDYLLFINLILASFNLVPIPPLDGPHVVAHFIPARFAPAYRRMGQFGILVLMGMMYLIPGAFSIILWPVYFLQGLADSFIRLWI